MPPEHYEQAVARAVELIRGGRMSKIVLSREVQVHAPRPYDPAAIFGVLRAEFPSCFCFCAGRGESTLIAASPELLLRREGQRVSTLALAASSRRSADPAVDAHLGEQLLRDPSYREEHAIVARRIERTLRPHSVWVAAAPEPELARIANIQHLATPIRAQLAAPIEALELAGLMHPTPAVGGEPLAAAAPLIPALEGLDRGWYLGPVGWTDAAGDGEFCVALRCALLERTGRPLLRGRRHRPRLGAGQGARRDGDQARGAAAAARALGGPRGGRDRLPDARVQLDVRARARRAPRRSTTSPPRAERALERGAEAADVLGALVREAVQRGGRREVQAGRRRDVAPRRSPGSPARERRACDFEEVEDAAAAVVQQHDRELQAEPAGGEQAAEVVGERDVADQQHDGPVARGGGAERARDDPVDAVGAAVAQHARRVRPRRPEASRCPARASRRRRTASPPRAAAPRAPPPPPARRARRRRARRRSPRAARSSALRQLAGPLGLRGARVGRRPAP